MPTDTSRRLDEIADAADDRAADAVLEGDAPRKPEPPSWGDALGEASGLVRDGVVIGVRVLRPLVEPAVKAALRSAAGAIVAALEEKV